MGAQVVPGRHAGSGPVLKRADAFLSDVSVGPLGRTKSSWKPQLRPAVHTPGVHLEGMTLKFIWTELCDILSLRKAGLVPASGAPLPRTSNGSIDH